MSEPFDHARRSALKQLALGLSALSLAGTAQAADEPLLGEDEPNAKELQYVADVSRAKTAKPDQTCANCSLFDGASGATQGHCVLFAGKQVKAAGWCAAWTNM